MLVLTLTAIASAGAIATWVWDRRRGQKRNAKGSCAACGVPWPSADGEPYLIHGRLVCQPCADKARRRMPWELAALAGWAALVAGSALVGLVSGSALTGMQMLLMALVLPAATLLGPLAVVQLMKLANRRAQQRIAAGEFPGLDSSSPGAPGAEDALLPDGSANDR